MAWNTIPDKSTGDLMDETWYDTYFKANMEYLLDPNHEQIIRNNGSSYTTTSTSFVDVDATNLSITLTTNGGPVLISVICTLDHNPGNLVGLDIDVDGTRLGNSYTYGLVEMQIVNTTPPRTNGSFSILVTGLSAGSHTFKLQWRTYGGGTAEMLSATSTNPVVFSAIEL